MSQSYIARFCSGVRVVGDDLADGEPEEAVQLAHPVGVAGREVVVDGDEVHAPARERVEIRRQRGDEGLALAGLHLGDPAEVQRGAAHELHVEVALAEHPAPGLADGRERVGEQVVEQVGDELLAVLGVLARGPGPVDLLAELGRCGPGAARR